MTIAHGVMFVAHLAASLAAVVVLAVMRNEARARIQTHGSPAATSGRNVAARLYHLIPVTGAVVVATSQGDISWSEHWVAAGIGLYLVGAMILESRVLPAERARRDHDVVRGVEWSVVLLALAALVMLIQF